MGQVVERLPSKQWGPELKPQYHKKEKKKKKKKSFIKLEKLSLRRLQGTKLV
jgi:hypothetical protein